MSDNSPTTALMIKSTCTLPLFYLHPEDRKDIDPQSICMSYPSITRPWDPVSMLLCDSHLNKCVWKNWAQSMLGGSKKLYMWSFEAKKLVHVDFITHGYVIIVTFFFVYLSSFMMASGMGLTRRCSIIADLRWLSMEWHPLASKVPSIRRPR